MSESEPWSVYNTRLNLSLSANSSDSTSSVIAQLFNALPFDGASDLHVETPCRTTVTPELHPSSHVDTPIVCSPLPIQSKISDFYHETCTGSIVDFTSTWRYGDLMQNGHTQTMTITHPCIARGCYQVFKRQNDRIEHEFKRHPDLQSTSFQPRRQGIDHGSRTQSPHLGSTTLVNNSDTDKKHQLQSAFPYNDIELVTKSDAKLRDVILALVGVWPLTGMPPVKHEKTCSRLSQSSSSYRSANQDQYSEVSHECSTSVTATDMTSISDTSPSQYLDYPGMVKFTKSRPCCPVLGCTKQIAFYGLFVSHFMGEHINDFRKDTTDLICCNFCEDSWWCAGEDVFTKHLWDFHMLITGLTDQLDALDVEVELESSYTPYHTSMIQRGDAAVSSNNLIAGDPLPQSPRNTQSLVQAIPAVPQTSFADFTQNQTVHRQLGSIQTILSRSQRVVNDTERTLKACQNSSETAQLESFTSAKDTQVLRSRLWINFFCRWDGILEVLYSRKSHSHELFAGKLEETLQNLQLRGAVMSGSTYIEGQKTFTKDEPQSGADHTKKRMCPEDRNGTSSRDSKRCLKKGYCPARGTEGEIQVQQFTEPMGFTPVEVNCIIYKHHLMHGTLSECPCKGYKAATMSQLRTKHLSPSKAGGHGGFMQFLERCDNCKEDVLDKDLWSIHEAHHCEQKTQRKGELVARWARLYLARYPNEQRIPNPYVGEDVWLTDVESDRYKKAFSANAISTGISPEFCPGDQQLPSSTPIQPVAGMEILVPCQSKPRLSGITTNTPTIEGLERTVETEIVLENVVDPYSLMSYNVPTSPKSNSPPSLQDLIYGALQLLSRLCRETIDPSNKTDRYSMADRLQKSFDSIIAILRGGDQSRQFSASAVTTSPHKPRSDYQGLQQLNSQTYCKVSSLSTLPSTQGYEGKSSGDRMSTSTDSLCTTSLFNTMDPFIYKDKKEGLSLEEASVMYDPSGYLPYKAFPDLCRPGDAELDPTTAVIRDRPSLDPDQLKDHKFESFIREIEQYQKPAA